MLISEIKHRPLEFAILFVILILGAIGYIHFGYHPHSQRRVVYLTGAAYFLWSLYHHYRRGDLDVSLVVEYLTMALLGSLLLSGTLL